MTTTQCVATPPGNGERIDDHLTPIPSELIVVSHRRENVAAETDSLIESQASVEKALASTCCDYWSRHSPKRS